MVVRTRKACVRPRRVSTSFARFNACVYAAIGVRFNAAGLSRVGVIITKILTRVYLFCAFACFAQAVMLRCALARHRLLPSAFSVLLQDLLVCMGAAFAPAPFAA